MRILITGDNSYVGISLEKWLKQWPDKYCIDTISMLNDMWRSYDFTGYDCVFHVAGIVHQKEEPKYEMLYYKVNRDLAIEVARKAKNADIKQFVFMSSMSVYGLEGGIDKDTIISKDTPCFPKTYYGKSKLEAELDLIKMSDEKFSVAIIRAPMIYGPNCPGNYSRLRNLTKKVILFPLIDNRRSMIYINNLAEFLRLIMDNNNQGIFCPQNKEYISTKRLFEITSSNHKNIYFSRILGHVIVLLSKKFIILKKAFGSLVYDSDISSYYNWSYCIFTTEESLLETESNWKQLK